MSPSWIGVRAFHKGWPLCPTAGIPQKGLAASHQEEFWWKHRSMPQDISERCKFSKLQDMSWHVLFFLMEDTIVTPLEKMVSFRPCVFDARRDRRVAGLKCWHSCGRMQCIPSGRLSSSGLLDNWAKDGQFNGCERRNCLLSKHKNKTSQTLLSFVHASQSSTHRPILEVDPWNRNH